VAGRYLSMSIDFIKVSQFNISRIDNRFSANGFEFGEGKKFFIQLCKLDYTLLQNSQNWLCNIVRELYGATR